MNTFLRNFITNWRKLDLPESGGTYVAAVSGGADSLSVLLALNELKNRKKLDHRFVVAHFNHGLRGSESDADEEFVRELTVKYGFELAVGRGQVEREGNLEQNARLARYEFLTRTAENLHASGVLTGHTMNDQAETFLINLIRGSGPDGLGGMKAVRSLKTPTLADTAGPEVQASMFDAPGFGVLLIRPLLNWARRADTENFCREMGVEYRYDTMNEDLAFKRVRVRKLLIPMLEDFNPKIIETLARTAGLMGNGAVENGGEPSPIEITEKLAIRDLKTLSKHDLYRTLRAWLEQRRGDLRQLDLRHIEAIESLIFSTKSGKTAELPGGEAVIKEGGKLGWRGRKTESTEI